MKLDGKLFGGPMSDEGIRDKWYDQDFIQIASDEAIRLDREERHMLLEEYISFDSKLYERLTKALCMPAGVKRDAEIDDLFMDAARFVADKAVNDRNSYYWRKDE